MSNKFEERRKERSKRLHGFKTPRANSFLIVTEGECTEPAYFESLATLITEKIGGSIDSINIPYVEVEGKGRSTIRLLEIVDEIVNKAKIIYQNIWVVFDKDDFDDFDKAVKLGIEKGYKIAWNNQSFEYWLFLHFYYSDSALSRDEWNKKLSQIFKKNKIANGTYQKNDPEIFSLVGGLNGAKTAIQNAEKRMKDYDKNTLPSLYNPGTQTHILTKELISYID